MKFFYTFLLQITVFISASFIDEKNLKETIFSPTVYDPRSAPPNRPIRCSVQLQVDSILEVDTLRSKAVLRVAVEFGWNDQRMVWTPASYNNLNYIIVSGDQESSFPVWVPDLALYESVEISLINLDIGFVRIMANGDMYYTRFGILNINMFVDLFKYPYDKQTIILTWDSWRYTYEVLEVYFATPAIDINPTRYRDHITWNLRSFSNNISFITYPNIGTYGTMRFKIFIERDGKTIRNTLVMPAVGIGCLALLYYFIPRGISERVEYLTTLLLTEVMLLVILTQYLPFSQNNPILEQILLVLVLMLLASTGVVAILDWWTRLVNKKKVKKEEALLRHSPEKIAKMNLFNKLTDNKEIKKKKKKEDLERFIKIFDFVFFIVFGITYCSLVGYYLYRWKF